MIDFLKKYELWIFLILAPIVNIFFVRARAEGYMPVYIFNTGRFCMLVLLLIIILKITRGNKGIINLFKPMLKWKIHPKWYFISLIFTVFLAVITLLLKGYIYDIEYTSLFTIKITTLKGYIALLIWAFLGEVVWVSYCIRELSKRTKPFYAGQIVAVFWTLWFIPIILNNEGIFPDIPLLPFFIRMMGVAGMCAFIYSKTKSGTCVLVLQTMSNFAAATFAIMPSTGGTDTYRIFAITTFLSMLGFWFFSYLSKKRMRYRIANA